MNAKTDRSIAFESWRVNTLWGQGCLHPCDLGDTGGGTGLFICPTAWPWPCLNLTQTYLWQGLVTLSPKLPLQHPSVVGLPFGDALGSEQWTIADGRWDGGEMHKLAKTSGIHQVWSEANKNHQSPFKIQLKCLNPEGWCSFHIHTQVLMHPTAKHTTLLAWNREALGAAHPVFLRISCNWLGLLLHSVFLTWLFVCQPEFILPCRQMSSSPCG